MKRWTNHPLSYIKRGLTSLFVCIVALLPLVSLAQWSHVFASTSDSRKATTLPAFQERKVDETAQTPQLFDQPLISVTFDDGWKSIYDVAGPQLARYGIHTTQYIISGTNTDPGYMSDAQIRALQAEGHEVSSHTITHPDLTTLTDSQLNHELGDSKAVLQKRFNVPAADFASPYGHTDARTLAVIKKYYRSHRNTNGDYTNGVSEYDVNTINSFDRYNIIGVTVRRDTTVADLQKLVDYTKAHNGWLVLTYHQVDDSPSNFGMDPKALDKQLSYLGHTDVRIVTLGQVMDTVVPTHGPEF